MEKANTKPMGAQQPHAAKALPPAAPAFENERQAAELQQRVTRLLSHIRDIDSNANGAFDRITSIAKLTLHYMKSPDKLANVTVIADALEQIWCTAEMAQLSQASEVQEAGLEADNDTRHLEFFARAAS